MTPADLAKMCDELDRLREADKLSICDPRPQYEYEFALRAGARDLIAAARREAKMRKLAGDMLRLMDIDYNELDEEPFRAYTDQYDAAIEALREALTDAEQ